MSTILITGASRGIGRAVAIAFAGLPDARLALVARDVPLLDETRALCHASGVDAACFPCDVTDEVAVEAMAESVRERWGTPDVLVNNAGSFEPGCVSDMSPDMFRRQIEVNLTSAFLVTRSFLQAMMRRGRRPRVLYVFRGVREGVPHRWCILRSQTRLAGLGSGRSRRDARARRPCNGHPAGRYPYGQLAWVEPASGAVHAGS